MADEDVILDDLVLVEELPLSYKVTTSSGGHDKTVYLPKSLVSYDSDDGTFTVPQWLAMQKELI